jgi:hypothetical protein
VPCGTTQSRAKALASVFSRKAAAHYQTGRVYVRIVNGKLAAWDPSIYRLAVRDDNVRATFEVIAAPPHDGSLDAPGCDGRLDPRQNLTLGRWADN